MFSGSGLRTWPDVDEGEVCEGIKAEITVQICLI